MWDYLLYMKQSGILTNVKYEELLIMLKYRFSTIITLRAVKASQINNRQLDSLFSNLFKMTTKRPWHYVLLVLCEESRLPVDSPNKGSIMQKASPCHDVIMKQGECIYSTIKDYDPQSNYFTTGLDQIIDIKAATFLYHIYWSSNKF